MRVILQALTTILLWHQTADAHNMMTFVDLRGLCRTGTRTKMILNSELFDQAKKLRSIVERNFERKDIFTQLPPKPEDLRFSSAYEVPNDNNGRCLLTGRAELQKIERGFCNWLIPGFLMVGQYPGVTPEIWGPSDHDVKLYMQTLVQNAGINLFCCLQSEVPTQDDETLWGDRGEIYLPSYLRDEFPRPFTIYAPAAKEAFEAKNRNESSHVPPLEFWHEPIEDLSTPESGALQTLLLRLLHAMSGDGGQCHQHIVYLHCWGGRGRAGVVGSCLIALLYPELSGDQVLEWVQTGYETRKGADLMSLPLQQSPQTQEQRTFVRNFVRAQQKYLTRIR